MDEIAPDAPAGEWEASIPRGKCKVQPTKEDHYPMLIVPIRLDKTDETDEAYEKALGAELSSMIVFFGDEKAQCGLVCRELRLRQLCEAADVDLDVIPKVIEDPENDLEPLIRALEGKKLTVWTVLTTRKDTGEVVTDVRFQTRTRRSPRRPTTTTMTTMTRTISPRVGRHGLRTARARAADELAP